MPKNQCFQNVVLGKTLKRHLTEKRSNQSILKEINSAYSLEGLMLKLNYPYFGHLMQRVDSLEKTLNLWKNETEGEERERGWDGLMASPTQWTRVWGNSRRWWRTGEHGVLQYMGVTKSWTWLSDWKTTTHSIWCGKKKQKNKKPSLCWHNIALSCKYLYFMPY